MRHKNEIKTSKLERRNKTISSQIDLYEEKPRKSILKIY